MKSALAKKLSYIGGGIGLTLFAICGLLYGSLLGGIIGLNIVNIGYGTTAGSGIIVRVIVALGMISGIIIACTILVVSCSAVGWVMGYVIDNAMWTKKKACQRHGFNR